MLIVRQLAFSMCGLKFEGGSHPMPKVRQDTPSEAKCAPSNAVYIGRHTRNGWRKSKWANPFKPDAIDVRTGQIIEKRDGTRDDVVAKFRHGLCNHPELLTAVPKVRGWRFGLLARSGAVPWRGANRAGEPPAWLSRIWANELRAALSSLQHKRSAWPAPAHGSYRATRGAPGGWGPRAHEPSSHTGGGANAKMTGEAGFQRRIGPIGKGWSAKIFRIGSASITARGGSALPMGFAIGQPVDPAPLASPGGLLPDALDEPPAREDLAHSQTCASRNLGEFVHAVVGLFDPELLLKVIPRAGSGRTDGSGRAAGLSDGPRKGRERQRGLPAAIGR